MAGFCLIEVVFITGLTVIQFSKNINIYYFSSDVDECLDGTDNCQQNCINQAGNYSCNCSVGWILQPDGKSCADINECSSNDTNNCDKNALCTNTLGSFSCYCNKGYDGNGTHCAGLFFIVFTFVLI